VRPSVLAAGIRAELTIRSRNVGSIAHQPADFSKVAVRECRGDCVARCQVDQLSPPAVQEDIESDEKLSLCSRRIDEDRHASGCGHQLTQQFQSLCAPCQVSAWLGEARDKPKLDRVQWDPKDDRDRRCRSFGCERSGSPASGTRPSRFDLPRSRSR
jgi:hypothetical protein